MEAVESLLILIWNWISANRDALILEALGIVLTVGLIEALLRWRERRRWSPTRRQVAVDVGEAFWDGFAEIIRVSGLSWSDVIPLPPEKMRVPTLDFDWYNQTSLARFFEQEYERDFVGRYEEALCRMAGNELKTLAETLGHVLASLNPSIHLARALFGPEVVTALLEVKGQLRWTQEVLYSDYLEGAYLEDPDQRDLSCIRGLASKMGRALGLLWDNVD